jgi:hypothetical protein
MHRDASNLTRLTNRSPTSADSVPDWGPRPTGTSVSDVLFGTAAPNVLCGRGGGDTLTGLAGNDTLLGDGCRARGAAGGDAAAAASAKDDRLFGGAGNERTDARDRLIGCDGIPGG